MLKYVSTDVVFQEIPDETTLAINISNCPCHCKGCHSPYLAEDIGTKLTNEELFALIEANKGITCVAIMGGDSDPEEVIRLFSRYLSFMTCFCPDEPCVKFAWYSGRQEIPDKLEYGCLDYIKLGPYIEELGPLNKRTTNQRLYKVIMANDTPTWELEDITYKFWKDK